jgi:hypothetical protein
MEPCTIDEICQRVEITFQLTLAPHKAIFIMTLQKLPSNKNKGHCTNTSKQCVRDLKYSNPHTTL